MKLKTEALLKAVKEWRGILFGMISILVLTPCVSFGILAIPSDRSALTDLLFGLAIFFIMPTTLSSGVVLTREANGNFALALLLTTVTNLLSIVIIPFVVQLLVIFQVYLQSTAADAVVGNSTTVAGFANSTDVEVAIDPVQMLIKLSLAILLPLVIGKGLLHLPQIGPAVNACTAHTKVEIKLVTTFCLAVAPWLKVSSNADGFATLAAEDVFIVIGLGIGVHLVYLAINFAMTAGGWLAISERKATVIMTSQKTLPIAIAVLDFIPPESGFNTGVAAIACVLAHFVQILIDAMVASRLADVPNGDEDDENADAKDEDGKSGDEGNDEDGDAAEAAAPDKGSADVETGDIGTIELTEVGTSRD